MSGKNTSIEAGKRRFRLSELEDCQNNMAIANAPPNWWQKFSNWLLSFQEPKKGEKTPSKKTSPSTIPLKDLPVSCSPPSNTAVVVASKRPMVYLDHQTMGELIPRGHDYATEKARSRKLDGYHYHEDLTEDTLLVKFSNQPKDTVMLFNPHYGEHCHPEYGLRYKAAEPIDEMEWMDVKLEQAL